MSSAIDDLYAAFKLAKEAMPPEIVYGFSDALEPDKVLAQKEPDEMTKRQLIVMHPSQYRALRTMLLNRANEEKTLMRLFWDGEISRLDKAYFKYKEATNADPQP